MSGKPVVVGLSGASGAIYCRELLVALRQLDVPAWLVVTPAGLEVARLEHGLSLGDLAALAERTFAADDIAAPVASGSFPARGMVVAPCSIKTLSAIANSYTENLLVRAADVCLKEGRRLVLLVRETPLHAGHLELMLRASRLGAVILPPMPAFYHHPATIDDLVRQVVGKALDQLDIPHQIFPRWNGPQVMV